MMAPQFTNYGPPSVRALKERSRPETRATEVLIQIRAAARHALSPAAKGKP
jgi:NADPH:quinone reductase-like Zn-dependent oxidoreductase